ncbi:MAG: hypothetical protein LBE13_17085 [Bacteroidales bacterium]|nr:hypothetical protein [Bacteroidales bacterium]
MKIKFQKKGGASGIFFIFFFGGMMLMCNSTNTLQLPKDFNSHIIPEDEMPKKIVEALAGSPDAANRIDWHYAFGIHDVDESLKWSYIGAENSHGESQYALANELLNFSADHESKIRGLFWLWKMVKNKYRETETKAWLQRLGYTLDTAQPPDDFHFPDAYLNLSDTRLVDYETGALQGNKKAAFMLGMYYDKRKTDRDRAEYWYRIGAQNGSPECQYSLGQILTKKDDKYNRIRGTFWLEQAVKNGYTGLPTNSEEGE